MVIDKAVQRAFEAMVQEAGNLLPQGVRVAVKMEYMADYQNTPSLITATLVRFNDPDANPG